MSRRRADDPVRLLLSHPVITRMAEPWLCVLGLGQKVAALGGHLEVTAVFDDKSLTLIREPGPEGQPPILDRVDGIDPALDLPAPDQPDAEDPDALITVPLTDNERFFLNSALMEWGGSAAPTDEVAYLIGFTSPDELYETTERLMLAVRHGQPLTTKDWRRVLVSAEISFGSDVYGVGWEWETYTQQTDREAVLLLRDIQHKLVKIVHPQPLADDDPDPQSGYPPTSE